MRLGADGPWTLRCIHSGASVTLGPPPSPWRAIETAPGVDGPLHLRGLHVFSSSTGKYLYTDCVAGLVDEYDRFITPSGDDTGWSPGYFEFWMPLPPLPTPPEGESA
jgi:hypothetical protein